MPKIDDCKPHLPPQPCFPKCGPLQDGVYENARVAVECGCIVDVKPGEPFVLKPEPCCSTSGGGGGRDANAVHSPDESVKQKITVTYAEYIALQQAGNLEPSTEYNVLDYPCDALVHNALTGRDAQATHPASAITDTVRATTVQATLNTLSQLSPRVTALESVGSCLSAQPVVTAVTATSVDTTTVKLVVSRKSMNPCSTSTAETVLPVVAPGYAGLMTSQAYEQLEQNTNDIAALQAAGTAIRDTQSELPASLSQAQVQAIWEAAGGVTPVPTGATLISFATATQNFQWTYFESSSQWRFRGVSAIPKADNNGLLGAVTGSTQDGQSFVEVNGQLSVNGWNALLARIAALEASTTVVDYNDSVFIGMLSDFPATNVPDVWVEANGNLILRASRPKLWAFAQASGNITSEASWSSNNQGMFTTGDGSTTFRVPDLRSMVRRTQDKGRGFDPNRVLGTIQGDAIRNISGVFGTVRYTDAGNLVVDFPSGSGAFVHGGTYSKDILEHASSGSGTGGVWIQFDASRVVPVANENRMRNASVTTWIYAGQPQ